MTINHDSFVVSMVWGVNFAKLFFSKRKTNIKPINNNQIKSCARHESRDKKMKKIALIMLAVVSMALVSCGGGKDEGVKPASPAITYDNNASILNGCFEVKNVALREKSMYEIEVTATLEVIKDIPELGNLEDESVGRPPFKSMDSKLYVYDKNMAQIGISKYGLVDVLGKKKGDIINFSRPAKLDIMASEAIKDAKFVGIKVKDLGL